MDKKNIACLLISVILWTIASAAYAEYGDGGVSPYGTGSKASPGVTAYNQGVNAANSNDYGKALEYFKQALKHDKNNTNAMIMIGYTQVRLDNPDDAIVNLKAALKREPRSAKARQYLGEAYILAAVQEMDILHSYGDNGQDQLQKLGLYFTTMYQQLIKCKYCTMPSY